MTGRVHQKEPIHQKNAFSVKILSLIHFAPFWFQADVFTPAGLKGLFFCPNFFGAWGLCFRKFVKYGISRIGIVESVQHLNILISEESKVKFQRFFATLANPIKGHDFAKKSSELSFGLNTMKTGRWVWRRKEKYNAKN